MLGLVLFFLLPLFCYSSENIRESFDLSNFRGAPSAIVGGHVNVITGDFIDYEVDCVLPGPQPFVLDRVYSSSQIMAGTLNVGWAINYNHSAMYCAEVSQRDHSQHIRNYFIVADGMGTMLKYRSLHKHKKLSGGYRIEDKLWQKGLTNLSEEGISGKGNVANNEAWIDPKHANLRMGNGSVLHFRGTTEETITVFGNEYKKADSNFFFLPQKKVKLNRINEFYEHTDSGSLSRVSFQGGNGIELGYYDFYPNQNRIEIDTPSKSDFSMKFELVRNMGRKCNFLHEVERPFAPRVRYDYERYVREKTKFDEIKAARIYRKNYPEHRYTQVKYYDLGHQTVQNKDIYIKEPEELRHSRVREIYKPLGETEEPVREYQFLYHVHEKNGYLYGSTDVFDAHDGKKTYHYDKSRLQSIETFRGTSWRYPYRIERFKWGANDRYKEGHYVGTMLEDSGRNVFSATFVNYDSFGNVIKETSFGNFSGLAPGPFKVTGTLALFTDTYVKEMVYSQDQKNLLLEEKDFRKKKTVRYFEGTNLVSAEFLSNHEKICKRMFFLYDENGFRTKQIVDDGSSEDINDLANVNERLITEYKARTSFPFGLAEEEVHKAYDPSSGTEKQLKRIKITHSIEGWVLKEDLFDADDQYVSSKEYRYNKFGKVVYEKDPTGAVIESAYDANNNLIEEKGPLPGFRKLFTYDYCNRLIKEEEVLEQEGVHLVKSYRYNKKSERIEETDVSGNVTKYVYDDLGREIGTETPVFFTESGFTSLKTSTEYNILDQPITQIDPKGNKIKTLFTVRGKPYSIAYPDGTEEKNIYDLDDTLRESVDKYGNKTVIASDYQCRPLSEKVFSPSGELLKESSFKYSTFHLTQETDALGCITLYEYDFAGRLIRKTREDSLEEYAYDSLSRLSKIISWTTASDAIVTLMRYDNNSRMIEERVESISGILQSQVNFEYNAHDKVTKEIRKIQDESAVTSYNYNARGDLIETINPDGTSSKILYDYHAIDARGERGSRVITIDPKGTLTIIDKNALGLEKRVEKKNSLGETLQLWDNLYNSNGEKSKRIEVAYCAGKQLRHVITEWKWDTLGRLQSLTEGLSSPDEKTTFINYNQLGQRESITKPSGLKILYTYDTLGRVKRWFSSDNSFDYSFTYDAMDNPIIVDDNLYQTATIKTYDPEGRLVEEQQSNGHTVYYTYDRSGRILKFIYPDRSSVAYEYSGSQIKKIRRFSPTNSESYHFEALTYDLMGQLRKGVLPLNAGAVELSYDVMGRAKNRHFSHWNESINEYDVLGNMLSRTIDDPSGILHETYSYDDLDQLIEEKGAATNAYIFDSLYNRIKEDDKESAVNALNQIIERKDRSYRYDADGNLIELHKLGKTLCFGYDAASRMTSFTDGSTTVSYRYDETNRRILKIVNNSEITRPIYNGQCELGTLDECRILSGLGLGAEIGEAIAIEKAGIILVPIHDHNGNLMCLIDGEKGLPVYTVRYSAFGIEMLKNGEGVSWGFSSKRKDLESGLIFFGRRTYDPESGRYLTKDPLSDQDGPNLYAYVSNNPLTRIDLFGLFGMPSPIIAGVSADSHIQSKAAGISHGAIDFCMGTLHSFETGCAHLGFEQMDFSFEEKTAFLKEIDYTQTRRIDAVESGFLGMTGIDRSDANYQFYRSATTLGLDVASIAYGAYGAAKGLMGLNRLAQAPIQASRLVKSINEMETFVNRGASWNGSRRLQLNYAQYQKIRNEASIVNGRRYSGHALDRMQDRGLLPSVIEGTIENNKGIPNKVGGRIQFYDLKSNITVVTENGEVITTTYGKIQ